MKVDDEVVKMEEGAVEPTGDTGAVGPQLTEGEMEHAAFDTSMDVGHFVAPDA